MADLTKNNEDQSFRKIRLRIEDVQGKNCLTTFYGMDFTSDKIRSLVRRWQSLIEAHVDVRTTDGYLLRLFAIAFTNRGKGQVKKTTYAKSSQIHEIRKKMFEVMTREATNSELKDLVHKLNYATIEEEMKKACQGIYPLKDVFVRKAKVIKTPKFDAGKLREQHGDAGSDETGTKVAKEFKVRLECVRSIRRMVLTLPWSYRNPRSSPRCKDLLGGL